MLKKKKLLFIKREHSESEKAIHKEGKGICNGAPPTGGLMDRIYKGLLQITKTAIGKLIFIKEEET